MISAMQSARAARCPKCRTGAMFMGNTYSLKAQKMHVNCPHCGFKFEREPGYFYVSMFVSYAFNVAQLLTVCVAAYILGGELESPWLYLVLCLLTAVVLSPFNFRYSRVVQMYWLSPGLHFDPKKYGGAPHIS